MMILLRKTLREERGNSILFMLGILSVLMIMFVFVLNLSKVLAVKEQANTTAQQASLAATSVLYEDIWDSIDQYETDLFKKIMEELGADAVIKDIYPKTIAERVDEKTVEIQSSHSDLSQNEARRKAINQVVAGEMRNGMWGYMLRDQLDNDIRHQMIPDMKNAARETIRQNNGNTDGAEISLFHKNRVYVRASNDVEGTPYGSFFRGWNEKLFQKSAGPEIEFLSELNIHVESTL